MASSSSLPDEDLACPLCKAIFTDPVLLKCSHIFCEACLHKWWEANRAGECPICREKTTEDPTSDRTTGATVSNDGTEKRASVSASVCSVHGERLKLFCVNDNELICVVCQTSKKHENHKLRPIEEAVLSYKEEIDGALRVLQEKLEAFNEEKQKNNQEADFIKSQAECTVIQIQEEFEKLHQFLRYEEVTRIAALREEEEQKSQRMKERVEKMTREISSLTEAITALEQEMRADDISFLQNYKVTKRRAQSEVSNPEKVSGGSIDVAKHLGNLKYRVWERMLGIIQYTPVTLDPNTKGDDLTVFEDLTGLRYSGEAEPSSDDDTHILRCVVLGSGGFGSGKHSWDVEVGDNPAWVLGVAESSSSDGGLQSGEMWGLGHRDGEYEAIRCAVSGVKLNVRRGVKRVRVQLDWDRGRLSFSDPVTNTSLHTFKCRFAKRLFPLFLAASDSDPLIICPVRVSVKVG
ncbi:tripartite motif-containing protein 35-like [Anguilla anguilla]|uniref:tripartite motif-containing protein 35-like n=1 Tax=Anguilla anguilla TaxID=7936 RepID=UPI0015A9D209|nr:tripartite motif-containing protein 35-like [Anguilla anguilla]